MGSEPAPAAARAAAWSLDRLPLAALLAVVVPTLIAFDGPVFPRAWNHLTALIGWGFFCAVLAAATHGAPPAPSRAGGRLVWLMTALGLIALGCAVSMGWRGLPPGFGVGTFGFLAAAGLCAAVGARLQQAGLGAAAFRPFCQALVRAAVCGILIGCIQFFAPGWVDGWFIGISNAAARMGGNLRQPNQLCSLIAMAAAALVWLHDRAERDGGSRLPWRRVVAVVLAVFLGAGAAGTLSRSGAVCIAIVCLWTLLDRTPSRAARLLPWVLAAAAVIVQPHVYDWSPTGPQGVRALLEHRAADPSGHRFGLWSNCLDLIRQSPLGGVGWGQLNFAWSLTSFDKRFPQNPDNAHNLAVHLAVELGLPMAIVVCGLLLVALGSALRAARQAITPDQGVARASLVMVLVLAFHSLVEYPLWMALFLLPAGFALGLATGARGPVETAASPRAPSAGLLALGGLVLAAGGVWAAVDLGRAQEVGRMTAGAPAAAAHVFFYRPHAEWLADQPVRRPLAERPFHLVMKLPPVQDMQIIEWSRALAEQGDTDRARYLAQLVRRRASSEADRFFAPCKDEAVPEASRPYQCSPPERAWSYADFQNR
jgi:O-antigen ligase